MFHLMRRRDIAPRVIDQTAYIKLRAARFEELRKQGMSEEEIAKTMNVKLSMVRLALAKFFPAYRKIRTAEQREIVSRQASGQSIQEIAEAMSRSRSSVQRVLQKTKTGEQ